MTKSPLLVDWYTDGLINQPIKWSTDWLFILSHLRTESNKRSLTGSMLPDNCGWLQPLITDYRTAADHITSKFRYFTQRPCSPIHWYCHLHEHRWTNIRKCIKPMISVYPGLQKVLSSRLQQVDFPAGQVTFYWQVVCQLNQEKQIETCSGKANFENCLSKGEAGINVCSSTVYPWQ